MIEEYHFGFIKISEKEFSHDVQVFWDGEIKKWWRKEGHKVFVEDLKEALEKNPQAIVVGTGAFGVCKVDKSCEIFLKQREIEFFFQKTSEAVKIFNQLLKEGKKVVGLFHLTC